MKLFRFFLILMFTNIGKLCYALVNLSIPIDDNGVYILLVKITKMYYLTDRLTTIILVGEYPDYVFSSLPQGTTIVSYSTTTDHMKNDIEVELPYPANSIIMVCKDTKHFEESLKKAMASPYWYPLAKITIYIHDIKTSEIHWIFYVLWFQRCANAIIIRYINPERRFIIDRYDPYKNYLIDLKDELVFGCWTSNVITAPIVNFRKGFHCEDGCVNISDKFRSEHLGTCLAYSSFDVSLENMATVNEINLFEDKAKNYNGFVLRAHAVNLPFLKIYKDANGRDKIGQRDGKMWNTMAEKFNFSIELSNDTHLIQRLQFDSAVRWIFDVALRKIDLLLVPIFRMDLIFVNVDTTYPIRESGVCIVAHRAGIESIFSEAAILTDDLGALTIFGTCFSCLWVSIFVFYIADQRTVLHSIGSALTNTIRSFLSLGIYGPPKSHSFRILMTATNWGFFLINFSIQAAVISHLATFKRGKEVNTFKDVIEKGYPLYGIATPDVILPDNEEIYVEMNNRLIAVQDMMVCPEELANDTKKFCLLECSNARYMEASYLDGQGTKYLHVADERIHNFYLNMIHYQHSPMTKSFNKNIMALIEAGLIKKWEEYKFKDLVEDHQARPLGMVEVQAVFRLFGYMIGLSSVCFILEICLWLLVVVKSKLLVKMRKIKIKIKRKRCVRIVASGNL